MPYARIALLAPPWLALTYRLPEAFTADFWRPGMRVVVPLGLKSALRCGILLEICDGESAGSVIQERKIRDVAWPLEADPLLTSDILAVVADLSRRQGEQEGFLWGHILPRGLKKVCAGVRRLAGGRRETLTLKQLQRLDPQEYTAWARDFQSGAAQLVSSGEDPEETEFCLLRVDPPWPVRPHAKKQICLLDFLHGHGRVSSAFLQKSLGADFRPVLSRLCDMGLVALEREEPEKEIPDELMLPADPPFGLNSEQQSALSRLCADLDAGHAKSALLFGVTGSGKTAVYLELARTCLQRGKSLMLLAPEVAIACKLRQDAENHLPGAPVFIYHGYQSPAKRQALYLSLAARKEPCVIVGTRSSLFLPVPALGCIVLDEEHDSSFKQEDIFAYQAKEVAWFRTQSVGGLLVLGSATPDIKTFYAARQKSIGLLRLPKRACGQELPAVDFIQLDGARGSFAGLEDDGGLLGRDCENALLETLDRGEQAVILQNRRGYAPLIYCLECRKTLHCPNCDIGLTFHKSLKKLVCHYCGFSMPYPSPCPCCRSSNHIPIGEGTERLAERVSVLAGRPVLRLDRDTSRATGRMEEILNSFARNEAPVLVGTQMLSKGHHFPKVTLVIVADGDLGLNLPDYRAPERTFQLLLQAAGRAGRGNRPGRVLIQTRNPDHYCWSFIRSGDYEGFFEHELDLRQKHGYPPFTRLALLRISHDVNIADAREAMNGLAKKLGDAARRLELKLLGPAPAPLAFLRNRARFHCLLKGMDWGAMRKLFLCAQSLPETKNFRLSLDLDPVNML